MRAIVAWGGAALAIGAWACSLDLDESLIPASADASLDAPGDSAGESGSGGEGGVAGAGGSAGSGAGAGGTGAIGPLPEGGTCDASPQCAIDGAPCFVGECVSGACVFDICPHATACESVTCTPTTKACAAPVAHNFHAHELVVGEGVPCSPASECIGALGEFVFVVTTSGLKAWRVTNAKDPVPIPVDQPVFPVIRVATSAGRLLLLGPAAAGRLSIAWLDQPTEKLPTSITTEAVLVNFAGTADRVLPAGSGKFFLVKNNAAEFYPAALVELPLTNSMTVSQHPSTGIPAASTVVGASGSRLVSYETSQASGLTFDPTFSFESMAGTPGAQNDGPQNLLTDVGEVAPGLGSHAFSPGLDGGLLWTTSSVTRDGAASPEVATVSFHWPIENETAGFTGARKVAIETYSPPLGAGSNLSGAAAQIGATSFIVTSADPANVASSSVRLVTWDAGAGTLTLDASKRYQLSADPTQLGVVAGVRFGYVLVRTAAGSSVHVFDPACN